MSIRKALPFIERGMGCRIFDSAGNEYIDMCKHMGSLILGHANEMVIEAVSHAMSDGLSCGTCHKKEGELTELILSALPEFDTVQLFNSTTDALIAALRQSLLFTRRDMIVSFESWPGSALNKTTLSGETILVQYDNEDSFEQLIKKYSDRIAAVFIEPLPSNHGLLVQRKEFLKYVRDLTWRNGSLLVFDEKTSAFRIHFGGYYHLLHIVPDMVVLGNIIGNGMSIGAIAGIDSVMRLLHLQSFPIAAANPIIISAAIAVLTQLTSGDIYGKLDRLGRKFATLLKESKIPYANFQQVGSILWPYFDTGEFPRIPLKISPASVKRFNDMYCEIIKKGFFISSSAYDPMFISSSHSEEDLERFVSVITNELSKMESV